MFYNNANTSDLDQQQPQYTHKVTLFGSIIDYIFPHWVVKWDNVLHDAEYCTEEDLKTYLFMYDNNTKKDTHKPKEAFSFNLPQEKIENINIDIYDRWQENHEIRFQGKTDNTMYVTMLDEKNGRGP